MITMTIKAFAKSKGFTQMHQSVRENKNGYPFITFINASNEAENIYFSKRAAESVAEGTAITRSLLEGFQMSEVVYSDGRPTQWKISSQGESTRVDLEDLLG